MWFQPVAGEKHPHLENSGHSVAYYNVEDFMVIHNMARSIASREMLSGAILSMLQGDRALYTDGIQISNVEIEDGVATGQLPNGRPICMYAVFLRCK